MCSINESSWSCSSPDLNRLPNAKWINGTSEIQQLFDCAETSHVDRVVYRRSRFRFNSEDSGVCAKVQSLPDDTPPPPDNVRLGAKVEIEDSSTRLSGSRMPDFTE